MKNKEEEDAKQADFRRWHRRCEVYGMEYQTVSFQRMKEVLTMVVGAKFAVKITTNGTTEVRYVRGFADAQNNVVLISETSYSLALKILEVKDIAMLEYTVEQSGSSVRGFKAKWAKKSANSIGL